MCRPRAAKPLTVDSARCPRTTRFGNRSATPLPAGVSAACGMCCWRCCASRCTPRRAGGPSSAWSSSTPNRSRPSQKGQRGYDAGKRVKGRRRHIASDTMGLLLAVVVHSAGIQDRAGARALLIRLFMLAWLISQSRRLSKDDEVSVASAEAFVKITCVRRMVRLLGSF